MVKRENERGRKGALWGDKEKEHKEERQMKCPDNMFFVPYTPEGELKRRLQKREDEMKFKLRLKYIEKLGSTVADMLTRSDSVRNPCGRDCQMCSTKPGDCTKKGVVY